MKISVITVCFNSASHIGEALQSVDRQDHADREHVVVDGASHDDTLRVLKAHAQPWRRVVSEPDRGIYDAMNKGIRLATGDVVGLLNSDDLFAAPDVLSSVAAAFARPEVEAVYGDLCYVRRDDPSAIVRYWRSSPFEPGRMGTGWVPPHPTLYVRRAVYERCGLFDLRYRIAADFELMLRLLEIHRIRAVHLRKVLVHMRLGGTTNRSLHNIVKQNREIWRALEQHGQRRSLGAFVAGKAWSRGKQFLTRPAG